MFDQLGNRILGALRGKAVQLIERDQVNESSLGFGAGTFFFELVEDRRRYETLQRGDGSQRRQIDHLGGASVTLGDRQRITLPIIAPQHTLTFGQNQEQATV